MSSPSMTDDVAGGDGLLRHGGGNDIVGVDQLGCRLDVVVDERDGVAVVLHEGRDGFGVLIGECGARDHDAGDKGAFIRAGLQGVPFLGQVECDADGLVFHLRGGNEGLRQQGDGAFVLRHGSHAFRMLALPFDRHVDARGQAVSFEDVVEGVFGRRSLAACVDGLSGKVGNASDRSVAVANIQHAERVQGQNADACVGVVVEHRCQVGGDAGDVERALGDLRRQLVGRCRNGESVVVVGERRLFRRRS